MRIVPKRAALRRCMGPLMDALTTNSRIGWRTTIYWSRATGPNFPSLEFGMLLISIFSSPNCVCLLRFFCILMPHFDVQLKNLLLLLQVFKCLYPSFRIQRPQLYLSQLHLLPGVVEIQLSSTFELLFCKIVLCYLYKFELVISQSSIWRFVLMVEESCYG